MKWVTILLISLIIIIVIYTILNLDKKDAISVPPFFIYIRKDLRDNEDVIKHEECHWQQYERMGFLKFWSAYFKEQFGGYEDNELENECYNNQLNK